MTDNPPLRVWLDWRNQITRRWNERPPQDSWTLLQRDGEKFSYSGKTRHTSRRAWWGVLVGGISGTSKRREALGQRDVSAVSESRWVEVNRLTEQPGRKHFYCFGRFYNKLSFCAFRKCNLHNFLHATVKLYLLSSKPDNRSAAVKMWWLLISSSNADQSMLFKAANQRCKWILWQPIMLLLMEKKKNLQSFEESNVCTCEPVNDYLLLPSSHPI